MTTKEFLRRAKALAKKRRCQVSGVSRIVFPGNPRALDRLEKAIGKKRGGPSAVEFEDAIARLESLEAETEKERQC